MKEYLNWENTNYTWETLDMVWEEVILITNAYNIYRRGGGSSAYDPSYKNPFEGIIKKLPEKDIEKFIKIICRVNNIDYEKKKRIKPEKIKINISQLNKTFEDILKVKINM